MLSIFISSNQTDSYMTCLLMQVLFNNYLTFRGRITLVIYPSGQDHRQADTYINYQICNQGSLLHLSLNHPIVTEIILFTL